MKYTNYKGKEQDIEKLEDKELVMTYRFFLQYCNSVKKIITEDKEYIIYNKDMNDIKDSMKSEIVKRKLKMSQFTK